MENNTTNSKDRNKEDEAIKQSKRYWRRVLSLFTALTFTLILLFSALFVTNIIETQKDVPASYFTKDIKERVALVIKRGAKIDVVKHIYNTREIKTRGIFISYFSKVEDFYPEPTSLSTILNDIKEDYYLRDTIDTVFLTNLQNIIIEHEEVNPFDKLASNQKFMFENIRQKLDTNYIIVREDLNRVADEMNNRNLLVEEYLNKSNFSYWLSIAALALTVILSSIQIYQNRNTKKLNDILNRHDNKENKQDEN